MIQSNKVIFIDDKLENIFNLLPDEDPLKKGVIKAIQKIRANCQAGENIKKDSPILHYYKKKYGITNLRIYNLPLAYRLTYTITPSEVEIVSIVLDWMSHKNYDKLNKKKN